MQLNYRVNNQITATELRVVNETGESVGIMSREAALKLAEESELDLIETVPMANPPVAKIIDFDKFRFQKEKELKKQKSSQKTGELKGIRVSPRAAKNDLDIKARLVEKFLSKGNNVEIMFQLKGREKANRDWAKQKLNEFLKTIIIEYKVVSEPKFGGRGMTMQIVKK